MKSLFVVAAVLAVGCGGDGVSDSKKLSEVSASEAKDVCESLIDDYPERVVTCGSGSASIMITIGFSSADCTDTTPPSSTTCSATVGDLRTCQDAIYSQTDAQLCSDSSQPAACAKLEGCGGG